MKQIYLLILFLTCSLGIEAKYTLTIDDVDFDAATGTITKYYDTGEFLIEIPGSFNGVQVKSIGENAFVIADSRILLGVDFPNSITSIGAGAFQNNYNLQYITLPTSLTTIGASAFYRTGIRSLTIPNSVVSIGNYAFGHSNLSSVTLSNSITEIGDGVFTFNHLTSVTIPALVNRIGSHAFSANELTGITIPNTVTFIGEWAFYGNKLTSVTIPSSITTIEEAVFHSNDLTDASIPNTVTSIGDKAFYSNNFSQFTIPNSVSSIGFQAFDYNDNLTVINLPTDVLGYKNEVWKDNHNRSVTEITEFYASYAVYGDNVAIHTVTFVDYDDSLIESVKVEEGASAVAPEDPVRTNFAFIGWDTNYDEVVADMVVKAMYESGYSVVFKDWDGIILKREGVAHGSSATAPTNPSRTGYDFTGWDVAFDNVTSALTVMAQYTIKSYAVRFEDWDGGELKTETVNHGSSATAPANPSRTGYDFTGWDVAFDNVTSALTVMAQYTIKSYAVRFEDWDGGELKTETVNHGSSATAPANPSRTGYDFTGWDVAFDNVTSALTVMAQYTIKSYAVRFEDWDGGELKTETVNHGSSATAPANPSRTGYDFTGWDVAFDNVTSALTVMAQYTIKSYAVRFEDWDGGELKAETVNHGSSATAPANPSRTGYDFTGWDVAFDNVTSALTVRAQYTIISYAVRFEDWDGGELKTETVNHGSSATAPANPSRTGYDFTGWDVAFDNVTSALTVRAQYTIKSYAVRFEDWDGGELKAETVNHGSSATAPANPSRTGYDFTGWDVAFDNVTSALTVRAQYTIKSYA
ncbi:InlB B-repeat-containing protein, partial [Carboxylicivirga sp. RSCT41]|uniref:InlB B-repeat-containing protein n=1 Tax=Carboxylicivirga agarovorans TaxID=3417570 RepID=UPI003D3570AA